MEKLKLIFIGFVIGVSNIIPGVSGGTMMMSLGIYEKLLDVVCNFFKDLKENVKFLAVLLFGVLISVVLGSRVITYCFDKYLETTVLFFVGLIIGGIPMLLSNVKKEKINIYKIICFVIPFMIVMFMTFSNGNSSDVSFDLLGLSGYLYLFFVGILSAGTMVIPGLSGSFLLVLIGYYNPILNAIKEFTAFNNIISNGLVLGCFGFGILLGLLLTIKLLSYLLDKYRVNTYYGILGFVFASVVSIIYTNVSFSVVMSPWLMIITILLFVCGLFTTYKLGD